MAKLLIDEIVDIGNEYRPDIQPYIFSEPFANKDLRELIIYSFSKNVKMTFLTNGILFDDAWVDFFVDEFSGTTTISFSLDAVTQDTYEKVRGNYSLEKIEKQINKLLQRRKSNDLRIGVNFTVEEDNISEVDNFLSKWKYVADAVRFSTYVNFDREVVNDYVLPFDLLSQDSYEGGVCIH